jgi:hypothetical protein
VHLVKIDPEIFHFTLHVPVLDADLHHLGMFVARILRHGLEHLAVEDRRAARASIFRKQARAVDVDPLRAAKFEQQGQPAEGEEASARLLQRGGNIGIGKTKSDDFSSLHHHLDQFRVCQPDELVYHRVHLLVRERDRPLVPPRELLYSSLRCGTRVRRSLRVLQRRMRKSAALGETFRQFMDARWELDAGSQIPRN